MNDSGRKLSVMVALGINIQSNWKTLPKLKFYLITQAVLKKTGMNTNFGIWGQLDGCGMLSMRVYLLPYYKSQHLSAACNSWSIVTLSWQLGDINLYSQVSPGLQIKGKCKLNNSGVY